MTLEVLISTMGQKDSHLLANMHLPCDAIVINQCGKNGMCTIQHNGHRVLWIDSNDKGLSKSRNLAIQHATADICLLADDDIVYRKDTVCTVLGGYQKHPQADFITYQVEGIEQPFKCYSPKEARRFWLASNKCSSVEISFRRARLLNSGGAQYSLGEETLLLWQSISAGLKLWYVPHCIAQLHIGNSTWFNGFTDTYLYNKGANFAAMSQWMSSFLNLQYVLRKRHLFKESLNIFQMLKVVHSGQRSYIKGKNGDGNTENT